jgi:hypothetical protein
MTKLSYSEYFGNKIEKFNVEVDANNTSSQTTSSQATSSQETSSQTTSSQATSSQTTSSQATSSQETSSQATSSQATSSQATSSQETSSQATSAQETSSQVESSSHTTSSQATSSQTTSSQATSSQTTSSQATSSQAVSSSQAIVTDKSLNIITYKGCNYIPNKDSINELILLSYDNILPDLFIPTTINGNVIRIIGEGAFKDSSSLNSIVLPEVITTIRDDAFLNSSISNITISDSYSLNSALTLIGNNAFNNTSKLTEITIPRNVLTIGDNAFYMSGLTKVIFTGKCPTNLGSNIFDNNNSKIDIIYNNKWTEDDIQRLRLSTTRILNFINIDIPFIVDENDPSVITGYNGRGGNVIIPLKINNVFIKKIGVGAFADNNTISYITFESYNNQQPQITIIGESAFYKCTGLININIPASVSIIGNYAFEECSNLKTINVQKENTKYSSDINGVLYNKTSDNKTSLIIKYPEGKPDDIYNINEGVTKIYMNAFINASKLTSIILPESLNIIDFGAFENCVSLKSIILPKNIDIISSLAFNNCSQLSSIIFNRDINDITSMDFNSFANIGKEGIIIKVYNILWDELRQNIFLNSTNKNKSEIVFELLDIKTSSQAVQSSQVVTSSSSPKSPTSSQAVTSSSSPKSPTSSQAVSSSTSSTTLPTSSSSPVGISSSSPVGTSSSSSVGTSSQAVQSPTISSQAVQSSSVGTSSSVVGTSSSSVVGTSSSSVGTSSSSPVGTSSSSQAVTSSSSQMVQSSSVGTSSSSSPTTSSQAVQSSSVGTSSQAVSSQVVASTKPSSSSLSIKRVGIRRISDKEISIDINSILLVDNNVEKSIEKIIDYLYKTESVSYLIEQIDDKLYIYINSGQELFGSTFDINEIREVIFVFNSKTEPAIEKLLNIKLESLKRVNYINYILITLIILLIMYILYRVIKK